MQIYENLSLTDLPGEIWKKVFGFPDYHVSNLGRVKSLKHNLHKILKQAHHRRGYLAVGLRVGDQSKGLKTHRLVGIAFVENHFGYSEINHKNSNKKDNRAENIEWCNRSQNMIHMIKETGSGHRQGITNPKSVLLLHKDYGTFHTVREAAVIHGCSESNMSVMVNEVGYRKNKTKFILT